MAGVQTGGVRYAILDPTGNITALVEGGSAIGADEGLDIAAEIMRMHPEVEQVGFVTYAPAEGAPDTSLPELRMAGGEFCGNASMCAAVLCLMHEQVAAQDETPSFGNGGESCTMMLRVSGASQPVAVRVWMRDDGTYGAGVRMPGEHRVRCLELDAEVGDGGMRAADELPVVEMEGITHVIIERPSPLYRLLAQRERAEQAARRWCRSLGSSGMGLMFLEDGAHGTCLTPLVYVPSGDTMFWEHSCASGTSAVGMQRASASGVKSALALQEPGGELRVESDPVTGETWLYGQVRFEGTMMAL